MKLEKESASRLAFRAPADCVQYFTGASGSFQSYNFQGGTLLEGQNYAVCVRQEKSQHCALNKRPFQLRFRVVLFKGFCSISYSQSSSSSSSMDTFGLYGSEESVVPDTSEVDAFAYLFF